MRLLVTTQAVDCDDPYLGFFHEWLGALALHYSTIEVICLKEGAHRLPPHVRIHSLGKETGGNKLSYLFRFYTHLVRLRDAYDAVFVHMNPEYAVLGGVLWKAKKRPLYLWYNHPKGGIRLSLAAGFARKVFFTSPYAASARFSNAKRMPAGIDTTRFRPKTIERERYTLYLQGRVAPSKRVHVAIEAVEILRKRGVPATLTIVGPEDPKYAASLKYSYATLIADGVVRFIGPKPHAMTPELFGSHEVSLNLPGDGHYDKTVLESLACGTPVIVSSKAFTGAPVTVAAAPTPELVADAYPRALTDLSRDTLVRYVDTTHSLRLLVEKLTEELHS